MDLGYGKTHSVGTYGPSIEPWGTLSTEAMDSQYFPTDSLFPYKISFTWKALDHSRNCWTLKWGDFFNTHTCPMRARQSTLVKFMLTILYFREAFSSQQTERKEQTSPFPFPSHIPSLSHCQPLPSFGTFVQIDKPLWTLHQHPEPIVCTAVHSGVGHSMGWHKHMTHIRY